MLDAKLLKFFILHVNNNSFRDPLVIWTVENRTGPEADAASISVSLMTARETVEDFLFKSSDQH